MSSFLSTPPSQTFATLQINKQALINKLIAKDAFIDTLHVNHLDGVVSVTAENIGVGTVGILANVESGPTTTNLQFKTLAAGSNVALTDLSDTIIISATGGAGDVAGPD